MKHDKAIRDVLEATRRRIRRDRRKVSKDVARLLDVVAKHLFDHDFNVNKLKRIAQPTPEALLRRFRSELGSNPKVYLDRMRLMAARRLVDETGADPEEVAEKLGFGSFELFRKWFERLAGRSPKKRRSATPRPRASESKTRPTAGTWRRAMIGALEPAEAARMHRYLCVKYADES